MSFPWRMVAVCSGTILLLAPSPAHALAGVPSASTCRSVPPATKAAEVLARSIEVLGLSDLSGRIRVGTVSEVSTMDYQSDRPYPPYLWTDRDPRLLVAWDMGVLRLEMQGGPMGAAVVSDTARQAVVSARGSQFVPRRSTNLTDERAMDAWTVVADWQRANDVRVTGLCPFRDFDRIVLTRGRGADEERLFVDPRTGFPVKLERRELHALWGDVLAEYVWSIWTPVVGTRSLAPQFAFRLVDGEVHTQRRFGQQTVLPADSLSLFEFPPTTAPLVERPPAVPDTVRVASQTFLLRTPSYTNVVTLQRDTIFVLDAQTDASRAREDSIWIGKLFPGRHPVVVVVTDLAWPHIGGVRYWVANGAIIASRDLSRAFLERVVSRRWLVAPDELTRRAARTRLRFRPVVQAAEFAGGTIRVIPIDGAGSEGALMVYLPEERFLWTGDFVQPGGPSSFSRVYAEEVAAAAARASISPSRYAGMHVPLTDWARLPRFGPAPAAAR